MTLATSGRRATVVRRRLVSRVINPVLRRELTERWRGRRVFVVFTGYVAALAAITQLLHWIGRNALDMQGQAGGIAAGPALGRFLFENVVGFVLLLVLFIAPGYAAAQISGERERRSLALLQVTLLRPIDIVVGKLGASLAWLLLLVLAAMPFAAAAFFLGGVSAGDLLRVSVYVVMLTVAIAAMGLGVSSLTRRTASSVVLTYGLVLVLLIGSGFAAGVEAFIRFRDGVDNDERPVSLYLNPFYGLADAARAYQPSFGDQLPSLLTPLAFALPQPDVPTAVDGARLDGADTFGRVPPRAVQFVEARRRPVWVIELGVYTALALAGLAVATRRVRAGRVPARARARASVRVGSDVPR